MKQDVYAQTTVLFNQLKIAVQDVANDLETAMATTDKRITVKYTDKGEMACELKVAGDTIIFHMHTNVFKLDQAHAKVACKECHPWVAARGVRLVQYKPLRMQCRDCHDFDH